MPTIQDEAQEIIETTNRLTQTYTIWWEIVKTDNKERYPEIRGQHVVFFEPLHFLLGGMFFVICYQLFDHRSDAKHISGLIEAVRATNSTLAVTTAAKIAAKETSIKKAITIRHKVFAHRDKNIGPNVTFSNQGFTGGEMRQIVELTQDVVSDLAEALGVGTKAQFMSQFASFQEAGRQGCLELLDSVHRP